MVPLSSSFVLLLVLAPQSQSQVTPTFVNVAYVANGTSDQTLDFYWPATKADATVLFIHGGSLQEAGDPTFDAIIGFIRNGAHPE